MKTKKQNIVNKIRNIKNNECITLRTTCEELISSSIVYNCDDDDDDDANYGVEIEITEEVISITLKTLEDLGSNYESIPYTSEYVTGDDYQEFLHEILENIEIFEEA